MNNFEQKMAEIQKIVGQLEKEEMTLEQSLSLFEKGTSLIRQCQKTLNAAEQKISILNEEASPDEQHD